MRLDSYRVLAPLGSGRDGQAYLAESTSESDPVEVRVLRNEAANSKYWRSLDKRLSRVKLIESPVALPIISLQLKHDPPFIVMERREIPPSDSWLTRAPLPLDEVIGLGLLLSEALAAAHRLGLAHGHLSPKALFGPSVWEVRLDFTGLDCGTFGQHKPTALPVDSLNEPFEDDCFALGSLLHLFWTGREIADPDTPFRFDQVKEPNAALAVLLTEMLRHEPLERPAMAEVHERIAALRPLGHTPIPVREALNVVGRTAQLPAILLQGLPPHAGKLGRFRLLEKLGQGNMGAVYRAEDLSDGANVAVKVIHPDAVSRPTAVKRFLKEARLLAEVNNPYVTNLLEVNRDKGVHYLVMEFVPGRNLGSLLQEKGRMPERSALEVMADVARALVAAHEHGIVHRDIKPDNILVVENNPSDADSLWSKAEPNIASGPRVKLGDFGLARQIEQSESLNITRDGAAIGTPLYMSPEQATNHAAVTARSDVYSMGATLFHLLAGRPPFVGDNLPSIIVMHCNETPPSPKRFNPKLSDGVCQVVARALEKSPDSRYQNAGELLNDLERLQRGEPTDLTVHPRLPAADPRRVLTYDWEWDLDSSPQDLWPLVSNTERFNRAIGLPAVAYTAVKGPHSVKQFGTFRKLGIVATWEEHPFEWIEGRRMGILREYSKGILKWMSSVVELTPRSGGGTRLTQRIRVEPTGFLGRLAAGIEIGYKARRAAGRVYRRIDDTLCGRLGNPNLIDTFEDRHHLTAKSRRLLESRLEQIERLGLDPEIILRLGEYIAVAAAPDLARIRPLELAKRFHLDPDATVAVCLHGAKLGLFVLLWDILCPRCRVSCSIQETVRAIRDHANCTACNADFEVDFANSLEMVFRIHPQIRKADTGKYCISGPAHSPHVAAQVRLAPGERFELNLLLSEGDYRLRSPQLPSTAGFRIDSNARLGRQSVDLGKVPWTDFERPFGTDSQALLLENTFEHELVVRVERRLAANVLTAARATAMPLFRELFPGEILSPGQLISVANMTMVATDLAGADRLYREHGDSKAVAILHEHFRLLEEATRKEGGALVKTVHNGLLIAFYDTAAALRSGLRLQRVLDENANTRDLRLRIGVHRGPTVAATLNGQLDYFGSTVNEVLRLVPLARPFSVAVTHPVIVEPDAAELVRSCQMEMAAWDECDLGSDLAIIHHLSLPEIPDTKPERSAKQVVGTVVSA